MFDFKVRRFFWCSMLVTGSMLACVSQSQASMTTFVDSFDTSVQSNNINFEIASRQSGNAAALTYSERVGTFGTGVGGPFPWMTQVNNAGAPDELLIVGFKNGGVADQLYTWVSPNHNFVENSSFVIDYQVKPADGAVVSDWASIVFGADAQGAYVVPDSGFAGTAVTSGLGFLLRGDGGFALGDNSISIGGGSVTPHAGFYDIKISVDAPSFGAAADVAIAIDGIEVLTYTRATGISNNWITLGGSAFTAAPSGIVTHVYDNFSVTVPEPSSLVLAAFGALALCGYISRKRQ